MRPKNQSQFHFVRKWIHGYNEHRRKRQRKFCIINHCMNKYQVFHSANGSIYALGITPLQELSFTHYHAYMLRYYICNTQYIINIRTLMYVYRLFYQRNAIPMVQIIRYICSPLINFGLCLIINSKIFFNEIVVITLKKVNINCCSLIVYFSNRKYRKIYFLMKLGPQQKNIYPTYCILHEELGTEQTNQLANIN